MVGRVTPQGNDAGIRLCLARGEISEVGLGKHSEHEKVRQLNLTRKKNSSVVVPRPDIAEFVYKDMPPTKASRPSLESKSLMRLIYTLGAQLFYMTTISVSEHLLSQIAAWGRPASER